MRAAPKIAPALDAGKRQLPEQLRDIARDVRRIGDGFRHDPEAIALAKDGIATRLTELACQLERGAP